MNLRRVARLLGIGVGATGPGNIGMHPLTIEEMGTAVRMLRQLLDGESVQINKRQVQCVFAAKPRIPIYIGTRAPKIMRLAAELGDGIIYTGEVSTLAPTINTLKQCCSDVGRPWNEVRFVYRLPCSIDASSVQARNEVKGKIARAAMTHLGRLHRMGKLTDPDDRQAVERLWQHYDTYHHMGPEHSYLVRDEWVERFALAGTDDEVRNQVTKTSEIRYRRADHNSFRQIKGVRDRKICRRRHRQTLDGSFGLAAYLP